MENQNGRISKRKNESAGSTLPEIGKLKIGIKVQKAGTTTEYPKSIDYFRPTGNFAGEFTKIYGEKPKTLSVVFISDDLSEVCNERYECWDKGKRWGWGDGVTFTVWDATNKKYVDDIPSNDTRVTSLKWDQMLTLRFLLLEMRGIMGYWTFQTKAKASTIPSVVKAFDFVRERAGTIIGFPFTLMVNKVVGYNPGEAKNYPVVSLVPNFSEGAIEQVANYLEAGGNVHKLTTSFIKAKENLQLSAPVQTEDIPHASVETQPELFSNEGGNQ